MDAQCTKGYPQVVLNGIKKHLNSVEVDVEYPKNLYNFLNGLPSFCERMKIEKVEKLVENLHDKEEYIIHIRNSKQTLNHGLVLKKGAQSY